MAVQIEQGVLLGETRNKLLVIVVDIQILSTVYTPGKRKTPCQTFERDVTRNFTRPEITHIEKMKTNAFRLVRIG